ncbi:hypothetical protein WMY93_026001 [Mugilogobius chulae]|uniref:Uncharacterized protein n=1 Tax=Mugilogobius chulae TaxID=88201 RepID=A0AAW0N0I9_9GOBI
MDRPPAESGLTWTDLLLVPESGLNMDRPPAGARVRTKHGPASCWCHSEHDRSPGLNMDRPPAGARVRTKHGPASSVPVRLTGPASCWCQSQD